uniref:Cytochrome C biogenesis protein transmembrane domain-containing protein n=1 Tax=candidate division WOR-3 bacterium TaxID=2052148 RepID=A0A7C3J558_UNCW3
MIGDLFNFSYKLLTSTSFFSIVGSFIWGVLSLLLSPCHLSSIPLIMGYILQNKKDEKINGILISFIFSLGILFSIVIVGTISILLGRIAGDLGILNNLIVTFVFLILSLYFFNILNFDFFNLNFDRIFKSKNSKFISFIIGLLFGTGVGPCTFAFFAPVFLLVFKNSTNIFKSFLILFSFGLGHIFLIIISGGFTEIISKYIDLSSKNRSVDIIKKIIGIIMLIIFFYYLLTTIKGVFK